MRKSETFFEQVPIEIVENIIHQDTAPDKKPEKSRVLVTASGKQTARGVPDSRKKIPSKGQR
jgi:hypothetical protein